jgi:hypothetical protein
MDAELFSNGGTEEKFDIFTQIPSKKNEIEFSERNGNRREPK